MKKVLIGAGIAFAGIMVLAYAASVGQFDHGEEPPRPAQDLQEFREYMR